MLLTVGFLAPQKLLDSHYIRLTVNTLPIILLLGMFYNVFMKVTPLICYFSVTLIDPDSGSTLKTIEVENTLDFAFSPLGSILMTWERPKRDESRGGDFGPNIKLFRTETGEFICDFVSRSQSNWQLQFTHDEKYCARMVTNQIEFYDSKNFTKPWARLRAENCSNFCVSPGQNYSVAVFTPEKSGKPASVRVYQFPNFEQPVSQKTFFKAEMAKMKWNKLGTALLVLGSTDVDKTGKSYYGETNLYLLGIAGSYDSRIHLDKEGTIHDFAWSPNSREFGVVYGFMPTTTTIFDARGNVVHTFPIAPRNSIFFSPHARFILIAGFGNLQGDVDIYDRQKQFSKICTIEASNTSVCEWSPDGRYILTATTSPRLRVDNGIKIWHYTGKLIYTKDYSELFATSWRPIDANLFPMRSTLSPAPTPHASAATSAGKGSASSADTPPKSAYVPPHARNRPGASGHVAPTTLYELEQSNNSVQRQVPGSAGRTIVGAPVKTGKKRNGANKVAEEPLPSISFNAPASAEEKRIRSLLKKIRAIDELKVKRAKGEKLEDTQVKKIATEKDILEELKSLGWSEESQN